MPVNLACGLTELVAGESFDEALEQLPRYRAEVDERLANAADDGEREQILAEALTWNQRWLALAQSLRAGMVSQMRLLEAEAQYADEQVMAPLIETVI